MHSVADDFERPDADVTTTKLRVKHTGVSPDETKLEVGSYARKFNADITLDDNSTKSILE